MSSDLSPGAATPGAEGEDISPQEKARLLRLAAIEKRMKKNALPTKLHRTLNPPNPVSPTPAPVSSSSALLLSTSNSGQDHKAEDLSLPQPLESSQSGGSDSKLSCAVAEQHESSPRPPANQAAMMKNAEQVQIPVTETRSSAPTSTTAVASPAPTAGPETVPPTPAAPVRSNPVLEAALRRQQKNKLGGPELHWSVRKKQLVNEIKAILNSRNEEPFFGMPSASEEVLESYLARLKKKYSLP